MKRLMILCLCCCLLVGLAQLVLAQEPTLAKVISFDHPYERLKLRAKPSTDAVILGQYYKGVIVTVLTFPNETWAEVRIGDTEGYMMRKFLDMNVRADDRDFQGFPGMLRYPDANGEMPLYAALRLDSPLLLTMKREESYAFRSIGAVGYVRVLGTAGEGWLHILYEDAAGEHYGYASSRAITNTDNLATARVDAGELNTLTPLQDAPNSNAKVLAHYFNGVTCYLLFDNYTLGHGYARVRVGDVVGYIRQERLDYGSGPSHAVAPPHVKVRTPSLALYNAPGESMPAITLDKRMVQVLGERNGWYQVRLDTNAVLTYYVKASDIENPTKAASLLGSVRTAQTIYYQQEGIPFHAVGTVAAGSVAGILYSVADGTWEASNWEQVNPAHRWLMMDLQQEDGVWTYGLVEASAVDYDPLLVWQ